MLIELSKFDFQSNQILSTLNKDELLLFEQNSILLKFKKGQLIFFEGGLPNGLFVLRSGKAKIFKTNTNGKDQLFYIYIPGDVLGHHALLCSEPYEDSCQAIENCELLFLSENKIQSLFTQIPTLQKTFIKNMSHEFGVMVNYITVLAQNPIRERLALFLLILDQKYEGKPINIPREDLANLVGTVRENLGRSLKEFKDDSLIKIDKRKIILQNKKAIHRIASSLNL